MRSLKKVTAFFLVILIAAGCAACNLSLSPSWSYKYNNTEYPEGVYICAMYQAYYQAYSILSKDEDFDETKSILDISATFDESGEVFKCEDWIRQETDSIMRNLIALDHALLKHNISLDSATVESYRTQARELWHLGEYYYLDPLGSSMMSDKDIFYPLGVSFDSYFTSGNLAYAKHLTLLDKLYGKNGEKETPYEDVVEFFESTYTSYSYFTVPLYSSTTDEATGQLISTAYSDIQKSLIKSELQAYTNKLNEGAPYSEIVSAFMKKHSLKDDPSVNKLENLQNSSLGELVLKALKTLDENKATFLQVGDGDTATMYFIVKHPITDETDDYLKEEYNYVSIIRAINSDEFSDYLIELSKEVNYQINDSVIKKYSPAMFEKF